MTGLFVYPIKSLGGIAVSTAEVETRGLQFDRRWMLVDDDGVFLTQRQHAQMALFRVQLDALGLRVTARDGGDLVVPLEAKGERIPIQVWKSELDAQIVCDEANAWFSERLQISCRLVKYVDDAHRPFWPEYSRPGDDLSFADGFPITVVSEESLDDLNSRLEVPLPMNRFRPNIVLKGASAFAEDDWKYLDINTSRLRSGRKCGRCLVTTTDQETGIRGVEPLQTLATYRKEDGVVNFSQNYIPEQLGRISVGDIVVAS